MKELERHATGMPIYIALTEWESACFIGQEYSILVCGVKMTGFQCGSDTSLLSALPSTHQFPHLEREVASQRYLVRLL